MILTNPFNPDVRVYKEAIYLTQNGAEVDILCWDRRKGAPAQETEVVDGITVTRFGSYSVAGTGVRQIPAFVRFIRQVRRYLKQKPYDYYHLHDLDGGITGMFALPKGARYVFDMREYYEVRNKLKSLVFRRIVLHVIGKSIASLYENDIYLAPPYGKYKEKLFSLKNYPDHDLLQRREKTPSPVFRIGYHGAVRGQIAQFAALFEAVKGKPDLRVDVNGSGVDYEQLLEMSKGYDNVHVNGAYDGIRESTALYENTDVLFCGYDKHVPNHQKEAEAIKFFEAIVTATPMIMQCDIGMGDKVVSRGYGLAVETDNAQEIQGAIVRFMTDKALYQRCQENEIKDGIQLPYGQLPAGRRDAHGQV